MPDWQVTPAVGGKGSPAGSRAGAGIYLGVYGKIRAANEGSQRIVFAGFRWLTNLDEGVLGFFLIAKTHRQVVAPGTPHPGPLVEVFVRNFLGDELCF